MRHQAMMLVSGVLLSLLFASVAGAQDVTPSVTFWQAPAGVETSWFRPVNWSAGVPTAWTTAYINNGGTAALGPSPSSVGAQAANLHLGGHWGGHIHQTDGRLTVEGATWMGPIGYGLPLPEIYPGPTGTAGGTYRLDDGAFATGELFMNAGWPYYRTDTTQHGTAGSVFTQTRGDVAVTHTMHVGYAPITILADGTVTEPTGATADADYLYRPGALYNLNGGTLTAAVARVGYGAKGRITQRGGSATFERALLIGGGQTFLAEPMSTDPIRPATGDLTAWSGYYDGGQYRLVDGELAAGSIHVGQRGRGAMTQTGGAAKTEILQVGSNWWWYPVNATDDTTAVLSSTVMPEVILPAHGIYRLDGDGVLATGITEIGLGGTGHFVQDGGIHRVAETLRIGHHRYWLYADPRIEMADDTTVIPYPYPGPSNGRYTLNDGLLQAGRLELGAGYDGYPTDTLAATDAEWAPIPWCPAVFSQNGGTVAIGGDVNIHGGVYRLGDGEMKARSMQLTDGYTYGPASFVQTGGRATVAGGITLGAPIRILPDGTEVIDEMPSFAPSYGPSSLVLHDGDLRAGGIRVLGPGPATLSQTGGHVFVENDLVVAGRQAAASFTGGWLNVGRLAVGRNATSAELCCPASRLHIGRFGRITVQNELALGGDAAYSAEPGAAIRMSGPQSDFRNTSTSSLALGGLRNTEMTVALDMLDGPVDSNDNLPYSHECISHYEVAGKDLGFTRAGFWNNFVMDSLIVGTTDWTSLWDIGLLQLVDAYDNQPLSETDRPEALYVYELIVGPGSILDLNKLNLYALSMKIHPDARIIGELPDRLDAASLTCPGDADMDGDVDLDDFACLKRNFGLAARAHWGHGDYDGNGQVDLDDFAALKANFGAAAVPEPGTLMLLALGAVVLRRKR